MGDSIAATRVRREIKEFQKKVGNDEGIRLEVDGSDLMKLKGEIEGPPDTRYSGGTFQLAIGNFSRSHS
jgi:ubiquitin-protein ligase